MLALLEDEAMNPVTPVPPIRRIDDLGYNLGHLKPHPEVPFERLDGNVRYLWCIGRVIFWGVVFAGLLIYGLASNIAGGMPSWMPSAVIGMAGLAVINLVWPFISYVHWGFALRHSDFLLRSGVIWKRVVSVPFARIQHVDSHAGPLERTFGVASLVIHTAGSQMGAVSIPGLPAERAEALRDYLSEVGHTHANI